MQVSEFKVGGKVICVKVVAEIDRPYVGKVGVITELHEGFDCAVVNFSKHNNAVDAMTMLLSQIDPAYDEDEIED